MKATAKLETSLACEKLQKMSLIMHVILPRFQIEVRK